MKQENTQNKIKTKPEEKKKKKKKKDSSCSCFFTLFDLLSSFCNSIPKLHHQSHINPEPISSPSIIINQTAPASAPIEHFTISSSPAPISPCISYSPRTLDRLICARLSASDHLSYSHFSINVPPIEALQNRDEITASGARSSRSLVVVKRSCDGQRGSRDSMKEMMNQNGIRRFEDLQDCYLSFNAEEHHGAIVNDFRQISLEVMNNDPCIEASS